MTLAGQECPHCTVIMPAQRCLLIAMIVLMQMEKQSNVEGMGCFKSGILDHVENSSFSNICRRILWLSTFT